MNCGIYKITSPSGNFYIGSAVNFKKRWNLHLHRLKNKTHENSKLQKAFLKYGQEGLKFEKLIICSKIDLLSYEQKLIDFFKPVYNICMIAGSRLGVKASEHTKNKMRKPKSLLHKENLSKAQKDYYKNNHDAKIKNSLAQKIAQNKPERLLQNSLTQKASQMNPKVREAKAGRKVLCVENGLLFSCGHEAADWCFSQGLTKNKNAFVWINHSIRDKRSAYGLNFIVYKEI